MTQELDIDRSSTPLLLEFLFQPGWSFAALLFWSRIGKIQDLSRDQFAVDFWSGVKERSTIACRKFADLLFAAGHGDEALAALMLAVDPAKPQTFEIVLPQLGYAFEHLWNWPIQGISRDLAAQRLFIWGRAARGDFAKDERSIFRIMRLEVLDREAKSEGLWKTDQGNTAKHDENPDGAGLLVMPRDKASAFKGEHSAFRDLLDARLPLVIARDIGTLATTLMAEYPHARTAIDLMLRDLREGEPVRLKPLLLIGPPGVGKSRLARRLGDLLGIGIYSYDGSGAGDQMFAGSPKGWGNTTPSAAARAVNQTRIGNPLVLIDEIDKAGTSSQHGRLWDAVLPFLEVETAGRLRDVSLDAELDLSWISYIAAANSTEALPCSLRDRFRIVMVPAPELCHLPLLAANVLRELAVNRGEQGFIWPLAQDELAQIGNGWKKAGFSIRNLRKAILATVDARSAIAMRH